MFHKILTALALLPSIAFGEDGSKVSLASNPFNEVLREAAQISGARLVGLTAVGVNGPTPQVVATIPADWKNSEICLKVVSADGLYEAFNTYVVAADWSGGAVALPYPSKAPDEVVSIQRDAISAIMLKGSCATATKEAAPVFWGTGEFSLIRVLLNTARAEETFLTFPDHPEIGDIPCEQIQIAARNAFDTACEIPEALSSLDRLTAIALSFKGGEMGREEQIVLRFGESP